MKKRILIVDDEPMLREIFREAFEMVGFYVDEATNGREALSMIQASKYDCVLSDVRMPGGDGIELVKNLHGLSGPKPKLFLVTGFTDIETQNLKEWGVLSVFDKPFDFRIIIEQVTASVAIQPAVSPA